MELSDSPNCDPPRAEENIMNRATEACLTCQQVFSQQSQQNSFFQRKKEEESLLRAATKRTFKKKQDHTSLIGSWN